MHLDTTILLKTENNKKIISGLLFTLKTLFICLNALFKALVQKKKKKKKKKKKGRRQNAKRGRGIQIGTKLAVKT